MLKARLGTHSGSIQAFLTPHHIEIKCDTEDEVNLEFLLCVVFNFLNWMFVCVIFKIFDTDLG
jgi:hypothetical protein